MTRRTTIQKDNECDNCHMELPAGTECLTDDEANLVFCDELCVQEYETGWERQQEREREMEREGEE